jgi:hypothetical protein
MAESPDYKELLQILNEFEVEYLVVGGFAVMKYGEPRYTRDLDVWVHSSASNSLRLLNFAVWKPFKVIGLLLIVIAFSFLLTAFAAFAGTVSDWQEYTDNELHVLFRHPREWESSTLYGDTTNFGGPDGSVQVDASKGDNPEQVCRSAASHKLQPCGAHP